MINNKIIFAKIEYKAMKIFCTIILIIPFHFCVAQGMLSGKLTSKGHPVPYGYATIEQLNLGSMADENGRFTFRDLPEGRFQLMVTCMGFQSAGREVIISGANSLQIEIELEETPFALNAVVVSGTRTDRRRLDNPVAVNVLTEDAFQVTQSNTLSEGLCFQPGLRMETDCQTCNYTQLRMNGLGGAYSQILVDNRPVFTSLMSLYSLEQIPASQIERVEIVKGGGSVLYGSNAIAGTVNVITKTPDENSWSLSQNASVAGGTSADYFFNGNATIVNEENNAGISLFAAHRSREEFDANGDGFSEMPKLKGNTFGFKTFLKPGENHRLEMNAWSIQEFRRGGNAFDLPADRADQSEERNQQVLLGGVDYKFAPLSGIFSLSVYAAGQFTTRVHYTGIDQNDGWGNTESKTLTGGFQLNRDQPLFNRPNRFTFGLEHQHDNTFDEIPAYGYLIDQVTDLTGLFLQSDWEVLPKLTFLSGLRFNKHNFVDEIIATPRVSALFKPFKNLQFRTSYARGFKAPQAFETDLHIAFAGGGVALTGIDPDLRQESSNSYTVSLDFNRPKTDYIYGFTIDAFRTRLLDAFVLEETGTDGQGNIILVRKNGGNSTVQGLTLEGRFNYDQKVQLQGGFTFQSSKFDEPVFWSAEIPGSRNYLRTPDHYGFFTVSILPESKLNGSVSGVYTGSMQVPHFAGAPGIERDELFQSPDFTEINCKLSYRVHLHGVETNMEFSAGVQNIFNAYQTDFDTGRYRDSNYIYGPARPRTFFIGVKFGT